MLKATVITFFCCASALALRLHSNEVGVLHFDLPGHILSEEGKNDSVLFQTFLKGYVRRDVAHIRGVAFVHGIQADFFNWGDVVLSQHPSAIGWQPQLTLRDVHSSETHRFWLRSTWEHVEHDKEWEPRSVMPLRFGVSFPVPSGSIFEFHVEEWDRYWTFTQQELFETASLPATRPLLAVLPPLAGRSSARAGAELLAMNIMHHTSIGLAVVLYVSKEYAASLQTHPCLQDLLSSDFVTIITWVETVQSVSHPFAFKSMTYAHAVLASWRSSSRLLIIDADEFLAFDPAWSVSTFLENCIGDSSQATLLRIDTACKSCQDSESDAAAFGWLNRKPLGSGSSCDGSQLKSYGSILGYHDRWTGKAVVDPNHTHGFAIHGAHILKGADIVVNQSCAAVMHLVNFWHNRWPYEEGLLMYHAW